MLPGYAPPMLSRPGEITIHPWSMQSLGPQLILMGQLAAGINNNAWPAAGLVMYIPFGIPEAVTVTKLWCGIGSASGNVDMGVYAADGTLLVSAGTTLVAGSSALQVLDVTDTMLSRGVYYVALVFSSTSSAVSISWSPAAGILQSLGLLEQASVTLPLATNASPATFAKFTRTVLPFCGVQGYRTVGP